jgi:hypothetical protein
MNHKTNATNFGNLAFERMLSYYLGLDSTQAVFLSRFPEVQWHHSVYHLPLCPNLQYVCKGWAFNHICYVHQCWYLCYQFTSLCRLLSSQCPPVLICLGTLVLSCQVC